MNHELFFMNKVDSLGMTNFQYNRHVLSSKLLKQTIMTYGSALICHQYSEMIQFNTASFIYMSHSHSAVLGWPLSWHVPVQSLNHHRLIISSLMISWATIHWWSLGQQLVLDEVIMMGSLQSFLSLLYPNSLLVRPSILNATSRFTISNMFWVNEKCNIGSGHALWKYLTLFVLEQHLGRLNTAFWITFIHIL